MAKLVLTNITSGYATQDAYNANNTLIETALENTLSRDGITPNIMSADFDMNSFDILNVDALGAGTLTATSLVLNGVVVTPTTGVQTGLDAPAITFTPTNPAGPVTTLQDALDDDYLRNDRDETYVGNFTLSGSLTLFGDLTLTGLGTLSGVNPLALTNIAGEMVFDSRIGEDLTSSTKINWDGSAGHGGSFALSRGIQYVGGVQEYAISSDGACQLLFTTDTVDGITRLRTKDNNGAGGSAIGTFNAEYIQFGTSGTHRFNVVGTTEFEVVAGQVNVPQILNLGAGHIKFPAVFNNSTDVNTLDDYEEGTWTPSLGGNTTYNIQAGTYTKIGNVVHCEFTLSILAIGTGSAALVSGLPFIHANSGNSFSTPNHANLAVTLVDFGFTISGLVNTMAATGKTAAGATASTQNVFQDGTQVVGSFSYLI